MSHRECTDSNRPWLDMHMHTTFSDGDLSPMEIVEYATERNITHLAITDHLFTHVAPVNVVELEPDLIPESILIGSSEIKGDSYSSYSFNNRNYSNKIF